MIYNSEYSANSLVYSVVVGWFSGSDATHGRELVSPTAADKTFCGWGHESPEGTRIPSSVKHTSLVG